MLLVQQTENRTKYSVPEEESREMFEGRATKSTKQKCSENPGNLVTTHIAEARKENKIKKQTWMQTNLAWGKIISGGLTEVQTYDLYMPVWTSKTF